MLTAGKAAKKVRYRHSGYPGGLRSKGYTEIMAENPESAVRAAVKGMLPKGPLGRQMIKKLKVYAGPHHPHVAQLPQPAAAGPHRQPPAGLTGLQEDTLPKPLIQSTGRRKRAVARVRLRPGTGVITVNKRALDNYFPSETHRMVVTEPLRLTTLTEMYDIDATLDGGGPTGQAGALRLGISRGLVGLDEDLRGVLKKAGFLTRDAREKESKKYGLKKARKAPQYSKR